MTWAHAPVIPPTNHLNIQKPLHSCLKKFQKQLYQIPIWVYPYGLTTICIGQIVKFVGVMIAKSTRFPSIAFGTFEMRNRQRTKVTENSKLSTLGDTSPGTNVTTNYRGNIGGGKRVKIRQRHLVRQTMRKSDTANSACYVNKRVNR